MRALKIAFLIFFACVLSSFQSAPKATLNKTEAQLAFQYLNKIRINPEQYRGNFPFLDRHKITKTALVWNDRLAKVAETKALDMANRKYFSHVDPDGYGMNYFINRAGYQLNKDWLANRSDNNFESLMYSTGSINGAYAIEDLIIDEGVPDLGHRMHLLGIDEWNNTLQDIGIGFASIERETGYTETYVCVIIAKHDW